MSENLPAEKHWLKQYQFKKGQSGNPHGSRSYRHRLRAAKEVSPEALNRIASTLFDGSLEDLEELKNAPDVTPVERLLIGVVIKAYEKGDAQAINMLLDRFLGKVVQPIAKAELPPVVDMVEGIEHTLPKLSDDELERRMAQLDGADDDAGAGTAVNDAAPADGVVDAEVVDDESEE